MKVFDVNTMEAHSYEERRKDIFYQTEDFKTRITVLPPGGTIPDCDMSDHVIFYVVEGEAEVTVNEETADLRKGQCLITPLATLSMRTATGARILGVIIKAE